MNLLVIGYTGKVGIKILKALKSLSPNTSFIGLSRKKIPDIPEDLIKESFSLDLNWSEDKIKEVISEVMKKHVINGFIDMASHFPQEGTPLQNFSFLSFKSLLEENFYKHTVLTKTIIDSVLSNSVGVSEGFDFPIVFILEQLLLIPSEKFFWYILSRKGLLDYIKLAGGIYISVGVRLNGVMVPIIEEPVESVLKNLPIHRACSIEEVAKAINFLIYNKYISGTILHLNGGRVLQL